MKYAKCVFKVFFMRFFGAFAPQNDIRGRLSALCVRARLADGHDTSSEARFHNKKSRGSGFYIFSHSMGEAPWAFRNSFAFMKWPQPKNPLWADRGLGWAASRTR